MPAPIILIFILVLSFFLKAPDALASGLNIREKAEKELSSTSNITPEQFATLELKNVSMESKSAFRNWGFGFGFSQNTPKGVLNLNEQESLMLQDGDTQLQFIGDIYQQIIKFSRFEIGLVYSLSYSQHYLGTDSSYRLHTLHTVLGPEFTLQLTNSLFLAIQAQWGQQGLILNGVSPYQQSTNRWSEIGSYGAQARLRVFDQLDVTLGYSLKQTLQSGPIDIQKDFWTIGIRSYIK